MIRARKLAPSLSLLLLAASLAADDGDLDSTFWGDGKVVLGGTHTFGIGAVVVAPDEQVVVVGHQDLGTGQVRWYWRAVGDSDASPSCYFDSPVYGIEREVNAAAFDAAGRLLVAGGGGFPDSELTVFRFSYPDCTLDASFSDDGYWTMDIPDSVESVAAISVDSASGRILLGGTSEPEFSGRESVLCLLDDAGELVDSFSGDGWLTFDPQPQAVGFPPLADVAFDESGKILAATTHSNAGNWEWSVARFTPQGLPDPTFGDGSGVRRIAFDLRDPYLDLLYGMARDPNSRNLVLVGEAMAEEGRALAIARLTPSGDLDATFSGDGKLDLSFGNADARLEDVAVDGLGRILVAGFVDNQIGDSDFIALRFNANGTFDWSFGYFGLSLIAFDVGPEPGYQYDKGRALAIQAGRVVVAGEVQVNVDFDYLPGVARLENALIFADGFESGGTGQWSGGL